MGGKINGIGLLSGGLDSILAVKVLQEQGLDLLGITFVTPFFGPDAGLDAGKKAGIEVVAVDISEPHLEMLKRPRYGYGSQMNPCIDCHGLMLNVAGKMMEEQGADFLFTGEVLGQRPMSQRRDSMRSVEKLGGYPGRVLRPLSAKLLEPTAVEQNGLVDRSRLLDIQGRSRKRQVELTRFYGITDYPQPGGGCMLTKEGFSKRLRELFRAHPEVSVREVEIIKWGRAFVLPGESLCIVGRRQSDNDRLESLAGELEVRLRLVDHPGPTGVVISARDSAADIPIAADIVASYGDGPKNDSARVAWHHGGESGIIVARANSRDKYLDMMIS